ncbi:MAG: fumarylacetoacetate hydrolase family protein [Hyphomonadaceae bacterium]
MNYALTPPICPSAAIVGTDARFPVRRIFCVGKNYADHVKEMGGGWKGDPVFFTKPADALVENGAAIPFPTQTDNLHHEIELVIALKHGGANIDEARALDCAFGYGVGCDLTRRDRQQEAKDKGAPWDVAKAFDNSAPLSALTPVEKCGHVDAARIWLGVNGVTRQDASVSDMIWSAPEIIASLSRWFELKPGDLIFTGTPAGVGKLAPGDVVTGGVEGLDELRFSLVR